ncbi:MAG TPA: hypothetical protein VK900_07260 [Anaerolineales bacterium]|nr:hypothetical protein [Anaerolineales bacterium]
MTANPEDNPRDKRSATSRPLVIAAAILAVVHACLVIEGRGIEGFLLWVIILFLGYWLLFQLLIWLSRKIRERS